MSELLSVGLDVGTSTTQLLVSRLTVENRASAFTVPELAITDKQVLYKSPVYLTPLLSQDFVDGEKLRQIVEKEYNRAGITPQKVDTGAIIITGETSRKENARQVTLALSDYAGDFVVATAGPDLESILAAKGSGAVQHSRNTGQRVLHMDIGGGTSNLCLIQEGKIVRTGCLNVGGRLVKTDENRVITYVSPVLSGLFHQKVGQVLTEEEGLASLLTKALEMAAGLIPPTELLDRLQTREAAAFWRPPEEEVTISLSGGVAECITSQHPPNAFGDIGPALGKAIWESCLCKGRLLLPEEPIRATVIGAGCHSTQLSGSTVFCQNVTFPLKNLPVVLWDGYAGEEPCVLFLTEIPQGGYRGVRELAEEILRRARPPLYLCMEQDMAKALGQALALRLPADAPILCIDRVRLATGDYLDVAAPVGSALPVVVKTLVIGEKT